MRKFLSYVNSLSEEDWRDFQALPLDILLKHYANNQNITPTQAMHQALGEIITIAET